MSKPDPRVMSSATETLNQCLQAIEAGQATVERCIAAHPEYAELGDLLRAVTVVQELPRPLLSQSQKLAMRQEVLGKYRARSVPQHKASAWKGPLPRWFRVGLAVCLILVILLGGGAGLVRAAADSLPGDQLYGLKRLREQIQLSFADMSTRSEVLSGIAKARLAEVNTLAMRNQPVTDALLADMTQSVNVALAVQPDSAQRALLVDDVTTTMNQAQQAGAITSETKAKTMALLGQPPVPLPSGANGSANPGPTNTALPTENPTETATVNAILPSPEPEDTATPTQDITATPTDVSTEMATVEPTVDEMDASPTDSMGTPVQRPTNVKPRPTRSNPVQSTPKSNNAGGNGNGNAGGNGNPGGKK